MQVLKLLLPRNSVRSIDFFSGQFSDVENFSTSCHWRTRKKVSQYSTVDTERYSSLVRAVVSSKTSSQTPESIEGEDCQLYGPVIRSRPPSQPHRVPKNLYPLLNHAKGHSEYVPGPLARIILQRDSSKPAVPSVTRILQKTMPPEQAFYLERWKRRMIAKLGEDGFKEYSLNIFRQGKLFHAAIEETFTQETSSEDVECPSEGAGYMESVSHVLSDITEVRAIESAVHHSALQYLGIVDCVAQYRDSLCVIDWKTSEKPKPFLHNTYDNPLQVAAYVGALNNDSNYSYQVENGLIVVAYKDGSPAHAHFLNAEVMRPFWEKWLLRLEEFAEKQKTVN